MAVSKRRDDCVALDTFATAQREIQQEFTFHWDKFISKY